MIDKNATCMKLACNSSSVQRTFIFILAMCWLLILGLPGCGLIPLYSTKNEQYNSHAEEVPRAKFSDWNSAYQKSDVFVGIALAGGGSRAANFSAAILKELDDLGFLDHVTAISSVSGGSLAAAYYGLRYSDKKKNWSWNDMRDRFQTDFFSKFEHKFFNPLNLLLNFFTHYDHSDMMAEVFDDELFENSQYKDLGQTGPRIFINATDL